MRRSRYCTINVPHDHLLPEGTCVYIDGDEEEREADWDGLLAYVDENLHRIPEHLVRP